jgi:predicted dehydrogenase
VNPPRSERPLGVALVGTGMWATQIAAAAGRAGLRLVTCFSRDAERRRAFADKAGCGAAPSLRVALEHPDVEAALILTPNDTHAEIALACAERGLGVFVEKPIADTVEDASGWRARARTPAWRSWSDMRSGGSAPRAGSGS